VPGGSFEDRHVGLITQPATSDRWNQLSQWP
jgi:hypothetical protein